MEKLNTILIKILVGVTKQILRINLFFISKVILLHAQPRYLLVNVQLFYNTKIVTLINYIKSRAGKRCKENVTCDNYFLFRPD